MGDQKLNFNEVESWLKALFAGRTRKDGTPESEHSIRVGRMIKRLKLYIEERYGTSFVTDNDILGGYCHDVLEDIPKTRRTDGTIFFDRSRCNELMVEISDRFGEAVLERVLLVSHDFEARSTSGRRQSLIQKSDHWGAPHCIIEMADQADNFDGMHLLSRGRASYVTYLLGTVIPHRLRTMGLGDLYEIMREFYALPNFDDTQEDLDSD